MNETGPEREVRPLADRQFIEEQARQLNWEQPCHPSPAAQEQQEIEMVRERQDATMATEVLRLWDTHVRVQQERPDQLLVTRMELGGHWVEFGSPGAKESNVNE